MGSRSVVGRAGCNSSLPLQSHQFHIFATHEKIDERSGRPRKNKKIFTEEIRDDIFGTALHTSYLDTYFMSTFINLFPCIDEEKAHSDIESFSIFTFYRLPGPHNWILFSISLSFSLCLLKFCESKGPPDHWSSRNSFITSSIIIMVRNVSELFWINDHSLRAMWFI